MELLGIAEAQPSLIKVYTKRIPTPDDEIQELLNGYVVESNSKWNGSRKTKELAEMNILVTRAPDFREATTRLRKAAKQQNLALRLGAVSGPVESEIYIPYACMPQPEVKTAPKQSKPEMNWNLIREVLSFAMTNENYKDRKDEIAATLEQLPKPQEPETNVVQILKKAV